MFNLSQPYHTLLSYEWLRYTIISSSIGPPCGLEKRQNKAFSVCDVHDASTSTIGSLERTTPCRIISAYRHHPLHKYFSFSSVHLPEHLQNMMQLKSVKEKLSDHVMNAVSLDMIVNIIRISN